MATTPPLRSIVRTPPTPLHGAKYDNYQPYAIRKSTRFSTQHAARTPSPDRILTKGRTSSTSKKISAVRSAAHTYSPPSSAQASPQRKSRREMISSQSKDKVDSLSADTSQNHPARNGNLAIDPVMLPTPAKTPRKKGAQPVVASTARILFPNRLDNVDEAMPKSTNHGRRGRNHVGFAFGSFGEDDDRSSEGKVEIYTDSKERLPEVDESDDNPFYAKPHAERTTTVRSSKRRKVNGTPDHNEDIQEVLKRDEGMVYVFRGKKIYRKFGPDDHESPSHGTRSHAIASQADNSPGHGRLTRSAIKPRLLFTNKTENRTTHKEAGATDEEAVTDIEDPHALDSEMTEIAPDTEEEALVTPVKVSFTPSSPPSTGRATRAATRKAALDSSPLGPEPVETVPLFMVKKNRKASPFAGWQRTKSTAVETGKRRKRDNESIEREGVEGKKVKGNGA